MSFACRERTAEVACVSSQGSDWRLAGGGGRTRWSEAAVRARPVSGWTNLLRVHAVAEADEAVVVPLHERVLFDDRPEGAKGCAQLVVRDRRIEVANEQIRVLLGPADADRPPVHLVAVERALALRRLAARRVLNETVPQARRRCAVALHVHTEHPPVPAKGRLELLLCHFLGQVADEKIRLCAHATRLSVGTACGVAGSEARARRAVEVLGGTALADLAAD